MYTPRAIFSHLFLQICPFVLSLYTLGRQSASDPVLRNKWPISYHMRQQSLWSPRAKYGLCRPTYITWIRKCGSKIWPCEFTKKRPDTTGNGAVRSAVPENPTLEPNMMGIGRRVAELWPFEVLQYVPMGSEVGRWSSIFVLLIHWSHIRLFRYVRNVAREE